jgi:hypothetical protein
MTDDNVIRPDFRGLIQETAYEAIRAGLTDGEALELVLLEHEHARTTEACIRWYRWRLRSLGEEVPMNAELMAA